MIRLSSPVLGTHQPLLQGFFFSSFSCYIGVLSNNKWCLACHSVQERLKGGTIYKPKGFRSFELSPVWTQKDSEVICSYWWKSWEDLTGSWSSLSRGPPRAQVGLRSLGSGGTAGSVLWSFGRGESVLGLELKCQDKRKIGLFSSKLTQRI